MPDVCTDSIDALRPTEPVCYLFPEHCCSVQLAELCLGCVLIGSLLLHIANHKSANTPQLMDPDK